MKGWWDPDRGVETPKRSRKRDPFGSHGSCTICSNAWPKVFLFSQLYKFPKDVVEAPPKSHRLIVVLPWEGCRLTFINFNNKRWWQCRQIYMKQILTANLRYEKNGSLSNAKDEMRWWGRLLILVCNLTQLGSLKWTRDDSRRLEDHFLLWWKWTHYLRYLWHLRLAPRNLSFQAKDIHLLADK